MYNLTTEQEIKVFYKVLKDIVIRDLKAYVADNADCETSTQLSARLQTIDELSADIFENYQDSGDEIAHTDKIQSLAESYL